MRRQTPGSAAASVGYGLAAALAFWAGTASADTPAPMPPKPADAARPVDVAATAEPAKPADVVPERPELALVRDAVAAYRRGDLAAGDVIRARVQPPGAAALLDWAALRLGGSAVSLDRVTAFALAYPDYPNPAWIRRRGEEALLVERKSGATVRAFFARERPQSPAGKFVLAQAFRDDGLPADADALIRDTWRHDTFGPELELRILDAFKDTLTTADHRARMERAMLAESWPAARRAAGFAGTAFDPLLKARIAVDGQVRTAPKLLDAVPAPMRADTSWLFSRVQNLRRSEKAAEAAQILAEVTRDPETLAGGDAWWTERRIVARKLLDDGQAAKAYAVAARHGAATPEKRLEAEFLAGWIALRFLADPATARRHFDRVAEFASGPPGQARGAYWRGRAAEAVGTQAEAEPFYRQAARFPLTYYGQLAAARLGTPVPASPVPSAEAGAARAAAAEVPMVGAVAVALDAGLRDLAVPLAAEFGRGGRNLPELEAVTAHLTAAGDARGLLTLGKLATARGMPLDEAAFPINGVPAFEPVGRPIDPAIVHAIARQESAFDPTAGSGAGARGLMQLMPGTALATARKNNVLFEPDRLLEGTYSASIGAAHLGDLLEDWKGSLLLTFAAYNAGGGNVKKWIAAYGDPRNPAVDVVDWVERIPFSETRNYVQRVSENLAVYRRRLGTSAPASTAAAPPAGAVPAPVTAMAGAAAPVADAEPLSAAP